MGKESQLKTVGEEKGVNVDGGKEDWGGGGDAWWGILKRGILVGSLESFLHPNNSAGSEKGVGKVKGRWIREVLEFQGFV